MMILSKVTCSICKLRFVATVMALVIGSTGFAIGLPKIQTPDSLLSPVLYNGQPLEAAGIDPVLIYKSAAIVRVEGQGECMGVLIHRQIVVTAGHCIADTEPEKIQVLLWGPKDRTPVLRIGLSKKVHRDWQRTLDPKTAGADAYLYQDIAFILIDSIPPWNRPIKMAKAYQPNNHTEPLFLFSREAMDYRSSEMPDLKVLKLERHARYGDARSFVYRGKISDQDEYGRESCSGDSGAPIIVLVGNQPAVVGNYTIGAGQSRMLTPEIRCANHSIYYNMSMNFAFVEEAFFELLGQAVE